LQDAPARDGDEAMSEADGEKVDHAKTGFLSGGPGALAKLG
jgi:hypothetical protein